jgi:hypothetical protein
VAAISTDDRDVRWLLDLLAMLPPMNAETNEEFFGEREVDHALDGQEVEQRGAEWWKRYAKVHSEAFGHNGQGRYYRTHLLKYAFPIVKGKADDEDVRHLAEYCMTFFDVADRPECCELLEEAVVSSFTPQPSGSCGRRWAESVVDVAWRLWVPRQAGNRVREGLAAWPQQEHR